MFSWVILNKLKCWYVVGRRFTDHTIDFTDHIRTDHLYLTWRWGSTLMDILMLEDAQVSHKSPGYVLVFADMVQYPRQGSVDHYELWWAFPGVWDRCHGHCG